MQRLGLYLFRQIALVFLFTTITVVFVVLFTQSFRLLSFVIDNSGTALVFFQLMGLMMLTFLPVIAPLSLGIAVVFTYNKLAVESELVIMRSIGASPLYLARPAMSLAIMVAFLGYLLTLWLTPWANSQLVSIQYKVRDNMSVLLVKSGAFNDLADGLTFYSKDRGPKGELRNILIQDVRTPNRPVTIMAESGMFTLDANKVPQVTVFNGKRQEVNRETGKLSQMDFDRYIVALEVTRDKSNSRTPDPREEAFSDLVTKIMAPPEQVDNQPLTGRASRDKMLAELHQRLTTPWLAFDFCLIGIVAILIGPFNRRGTTKRIVVASMAIIALQAGVLSLDNIVARHTWLALLLYIIVLIPTPVCLTILGIDHAVKHPILTKPSRRKAST